MSMTMSDAILAAGSILLDQLGKQSSRQAETSAADPQATGLNQFFNFDCDPNPAVCASGVIGPAISAGRPADIAGEPNVRDPD